MATLALRVVLLPLAGILFSNAVLAHAKGWYPELQLAGLIMSAPDVLQVEWVRFGLLTAATVILWGLADYFLYRRQTEKAPHLSADANLPVAVESVSSPTFLKDQA